MEILAPAGSLRQLEYAVAGGADAVYLGLSRFSARAGAENFEPDALKSLVLRAHLLGVKVYVAVNTLLKDSEIKDAIGDIDLAYEYGVDALIIQDFGLFKLISDRYPGMQIHASTQMSLHNLAGCKYAKAKGARRAILARELSLSEISDIAKIIDTEVFVHGAICISYSGQCQMSADRGPRSANRGSCAQPCRQKYRLVAFDSKNDGRLVSEGCLISPKERAFIDDIPALRSAGVGSLKIEGRLRSEYYAFEASRQYSLAEAGKPYDLGAIATIFNRGGFTNSYLFEPIGHDSITVDGGKNSGVYLGKIAGGAIELKVPLSPGDGVFNGRDGFIVTKITDARPEGVSTQRGRGTTKDSKKVIFPRFYRDGDMLHKTSDARQKKEIDEAVERFFKSGKGSVLKSGISVRAEIFFEPGKPLKLREVVEDKKIEKEFEGVFFEGELVQTAKSAPITEERLIELMKKGSEDLVNIEPVIRHYKPGFMPVSAINSARREFQRLCANKMLRGGRGPVKPLPDFKSTKTECGLGFKFMVILRTRGQLRAFEDFLSKSHKAIDLSALSQVALCINPFYKDGLGSDKDSTCLDFKDLERLASDGRKFFIQTENIVRQEMDEVISKVREISKINKVDRIDKISKNSKNSELDNGCSAINASDVKGGDACSDASNGCLGNGSSSVLGVLTPNLGVIERLKDSGLPLIGDSQLNIFNSYAPQFFDELCLFIPSSELPESDLLAMKNKEILMPLIYGRRKLMTMEYCPSKDGEPCSQPCRHTLFKLGDDYLTHNIYCRAGIVSGRARRLGESCLETTKFNKSELGKSEFKKFAIELTVEDYRETLDILTNIIGGNN